MSKGLLLKQKSFVIRKSLLKKDLNFFNLTFLVKTLYKKVAVIFHSQINEVDIALLENKLYCTHTMKIL